MEALIGQTVYLPCLVDTRQLFQAKAELNWLGQLNSGRRQSIVVNDKAINRLHRYLVPGFTPLDLANPPSSEDNTTTAAAATNYTLQIKDLTLNDDKLYQCMFQTDGGKSISSSGAKLTVLKPPTQLRVRVFKLDQNKEFYEELSEQVSFVFVSLSFYLVAKLVSGSLS